MSLVINVFQQKSNTGPWPLGSLLRNLRRGGVRTGPFRNELPPCGNSSINFAFIILLCLEKPSVNFYPVESQAHSGAAPPSQEPEERLLIWVPRLNDIFLAI